MANYRITGPDGGTYDITAPDDASEADVLAYAQRNAGMTKAPETPGNSSMVVSGPSTPPPVSPRQAEDQSMAALADYQKSPEATMQSLPKGLRVPIQTLRDSVTGIGNALPFNAADEIQGALATPIEAMRGGLDGAYDRGRDKARAEKRIADIRSPVATTAGEIAGGMATGGTLQKGGLTLLNAAKPTMGSMALRGAGEGAAYGAAYGFGGGEGLENRIDQAAKQGGLGALTGGVMGGFAGRSAQKAADATIPTTEQLKTAGSNAYKQADQAGLEISAKSFSDTVDDIAVLMQKEGMDKTIHPKALAALTRLTEAQGSQPMLRDIDTLRRVVKAAGGSQDPSERRLARMMTDKLDDFVNNLKPSDVVAGDAIKATSALNKARDHWSRMRKSELIENAVVRAERRAQSTGSGGNLDNAIRQNIKSILEKRGQMFTADEREMMDKVIKGGKMQNLMRWIGKTSPSGNGLMGAVHGIGAYNSAGLTLPLAGVGFAAKKFADSATPRNVDALSRVIRSGGSLPQPQMLPAQQRTLLDAVIRGGGQGGGLLD